MLRQRRDAWWREQSAAAVRAFLHNDITGFQQWILMPAKFLLPSDDKATITNTVHRDAVRKAVRKAGITRFDNGQTPHENFLAALVKPATPSEIIDLFTPYLESDDPTGMLAIIVLHATCRKTTALPVYDTTSQLFQLSLSKGCLYTRYYKLTHDSKVDIAGLKELGKEGYVDAFIKLGCVLESDTGSSVPAMMYYRMALDMCNNYVYGPAKFLSNYYYNQSLFSYASSWVRLALVTDTQHHQSFNIMYLTHILRHSYRNWSIPYGEWVPDRIYHQFVSDEIHAQIMTVLLMHKRRGCLMARLPKHMILDICFWIVTK